MLLFGSQQKGIPMPWKEWSKHQTKNIHQLSTPYSIWRTFFRFENGWREPKLSHKVKGPKRGPKSQKRFSTCNTPSTRVPPAAFYKNKSHNPQATGQNKSENCGPTTRRIDSATVGRIKGIPIHPRKDPARAIR